jgi:hypothetical protein
MQEAKKNMKKRVLKQRMLKIYHLSKKYMASTHHHHRW